MVDRIVHHAEVHVLRGEHPRLQRPHRERQRRDQKLRRAARGSRNLGNYQARSCSTPAKPCSSPATTTIRSYALTTAIEPT